MLGPQSFGRASEDWGSALRAGEHLPLLREDAAGGHHQQQVLQSFRNVLDELFTPAVYALLQPSQPGAHVSRGTTAAASPCLCSPLTASPAQEFRNSVGGQYQWTEL